MAHTAGSSLGSRLDALSQVKIKQVVIAERKKEPGHISAPPNTVTILSLIDPTCPEPAPPLESTLGQGSLMEASINVMEKATHI